MTTSQPRETDKITAERDALRAEVLRAEVERLRAACSRENDTISQVLGRALGYPRFADDQKNFPGATDDDGVCVGDHVAASLADEAANVIRTLRSEVERLTGCLKRANDQAEHFERHWYLRGDEIDSLSADVKRLRATIERVAAIAHCGGWVGLSEDQTIVYVRVLTVGRIPGGSLDSTLAVLTDAIKAARAAQEGE